MDQRAHIIVLGNAKGGSGKSTVAMHIIGHLDALGHKVAAVDLDGDQATLGRYIENRARFAHKHGLPLSIPRVRVVAQARGHAANDGGSATAAQRVAAEKALEDLVFDHDFVVVDCPGSNNFVAQLGHSYADTLVTPINDSFVDFDLLASVDPDTHAVRSPSWYSEMVWEQRKRRFLVDKHEIDWVVMRNRFSHVDTRNRRRLDKAVKTLATRIGFRPARGLGERVIFRELFVKGLTLSDAGQRGTGVELTMSHVAARADVREMVSALALPAVGKQHDGEIRRR